MRALALQNKVIKSRGLRAEVSTNPRLQPGGKEEHKLMRALAQNLKNMSYVKNWLHCVWGTKYKHPFPGKQFKDAILDHIRANAKEKDIYIDIINGHSEHLHCLLSLSPDQSLSKVIQLIKGESSYWINRSGLTKYKFAWAVEYFAVSVSESHLKIVRRYIKNQEEHHRKKTWDEEYNQFIAEYGFPVYQG